MERPSPAKASMTVIHTVYHQQMDGSQPTGADHRFSRILRSDEQPYGPRRLKIGREWAPLETGWIKRASMMQLINDGAAPLSVNPSQEEVERRAGLVIELSLRKANPQCDISIGPGESCDFRPKNLGELMVRCTGVETRATLYLFPE